MYKLTGTLSVKVTLLKLAVPQKILQQLNISQKQDCITENENINLLQKTG